jgi:hypothetical protein
MSGFSQSLNVSVAAAITLYVAASRRRKAMDAETDLTPEQVEELAGAWIRAEAGKKLRHGS